MNGRKQTVFSADPFAGCVCVFTWASMQLLQFNGIATRYFRLGALARAASGASFPRAPARRLAVSG